MAEKHTKLEDVLEDLTVLAKKYSIRYRITVNSGVIGKVQDAEQDTDTNNDTVVSDTADGGESKTSQKDILADMAALAAQYRGSFQLSMDSAAE